MPSAEIPQAGHISRTQLPGVPLQFFAGWHSTRQPSAKPASVHPMILPPKVPLISPQSQHRSYAVYLGDAESSAGPGNNRIQPIFGMEDGPFETSEIPGWVSNIRLLTVRELTGAYFDSSIQLNTSATILSPPKWAATWQRYVCFRPLLFYLSPLVRSENQYVVESSEFGDTWK